MHGADLRRDATRCGAVRCGVVRCGAVWCGAVRCGAVWCGGGAPRLLLLLASRGGVPAQSKLAAESLRQCWVQCMERCRSTCRRHAVTRPRKIHQIRLEPLDIAAARRHPFRIQALFYIGPFIARHLGGVQRDRPANDGGNSITNRGGKRAQNLIRPRSGDQFP